MNGTARERLSRRPGAGGSALAGMFIASLDPATSEIAADLGYDFIIVDGEHAPIDRPALLAHVRAVRRTGCLALARGRDASPGAVQAILDIGCDGVVLPRIRSAAEVERGVSAARYPPAGSRGMSVGCPDAAYAADDIAGHIERRNASVLVVPQIETREAVDDIAAIVGVEGADGFFFGPGDLSVELGMDLARDFDRIAAIWTRVRDAVRAAGKTVITILPALEGADGYVLSLDLILLRRAMADLLTRHRAPAG